MRKIINDIRQGRDLTKYAYKISGIYLLYAIAIAGIFTLIYTPSEACAMPKTAGIIYEILYLPAAIIYFILGSMIYKSSYKHRFKFRFIFYPLFFIILLYACYGAFLPGPALLWVGMLFLLPMLLIIPIVLIQGMVLDIKKKNITS